MKYEDKVDLYDDEGNLLAKEIPIEALHPYRNPYMGEIYRFVKRTSVIELEKIEDMLRAGRAGWSTIVGQDEIKMPWYGFDVELVDNAEYVADELIKLLQAKPDDGTEVRVLEGGTILVVQLSDEVLARSYDISPTLTRVATALSQVIAKIANLHPLEHPYKIGLLKAVLWGRYPQSTGTPPGHPVHPLLKLPTSLEGLGNGLKSLMINHIAALADMRTMWALALGTILEQGAAAEMGYNVGWFERYMLLTAAYQGFNANSLVLDLIKENSKGTVGDVMAGMLQKALEHGVIVRKGDKYPWVLPSGAVMWAAPDLILWNAYSIAGLTAAAIVNCAAARAVQGAASVCAFYPDMLIWETCGLPDPDAGRILGCGQGYVFYTHGLYGGAAPGAFSCDHVIVKNTSGFLTPISAACACLDAGTQIFKVTTTSGLYFTLAQEFPIFREPMKRVAEAAEKIKSEI
ncbi:MAG: methyl-coenzyme M reductase subunit beta [Archaeoglobales archaeon]|nr:MAG: methyl-coenzyme M reductase subunit beta [Archaeoglobales archaeon]